MGDDSMSTSEGLKLDLDLDIHQFEELVLLEADAIAESPMAIRTDLNNEPAFRKFVAAIKAAGGNVSPVLCRQKVGGKYELVYGHRRLAACRELGLPVLAIVRQLEENELSVFMDFENQGRRNVSAYERGRWYMNLLKTGRFVSQAELSRRLNVSQSDLSNMIILARLDHRVIGAFKSPADLQTRFAKRLRDAWELDKQVVLYRIKQVADLKKTNPNLPAMQIYSILIGKVGGQIATDMALSTVASQSEIQDGAVRQSNAYPIMSRGREIGMVTAESENGMLAAKLFGAAWSEEQLADAADALSQIFDNRNQL